MKKTIAIRLLCLALSALLLLPLLTSCTEKLEENQIALEWHLGAVTSDTHKTPETLLDGEALYSYSDVIHLAKAGSKLTFRDDNSAEMPDTERAGKDIYVISHWVEKDGTWVLEDPADHYTGSDHLDWKLESYGGDSVSYTYVSTYDNEYVRLCYRSGQTTENERKFPFPKVYVTATEEQGTLTRIPAEQKALELKRTIANAAATANTDFYDKGLEGLTVYCLGDSYFDDPAVGFNWSDILAAKYGMTLKNYGVSGSTIANNTTLQSAGGMQPGATKGTNPMCLRINAKMPKNGKPDIILFDGGRNDFSKEIPMGTIESMDESTFRGAINSCIAQLQARYPDALIIGITCWSVTRTRQCDGLTQREFGQAMIEQCEYNGIPCINQIDELFTGVHMDDANFRATYCKSPTDISHLNAKGQIRYFPTMEETVSKMYAAYLASKK